MNPMERILEIFRLIAQLVAGVESAQSEDREALDAELEELWPQLTDAQVGEVESELVELFNGIRDDADNDLEIPARNIAALGVITQGVTNVRALAHNREVEAQEEADAIAALEAQISGEGGESEGTGETEGTEGTDGATGTEATAESGSEADDGANADAEAIAAAAAASTAPATRPANVQVRAHQPARLRRTPRTEAAQRNPHVALVASAGGSLSGWDDVARAMSDTYNSQGADSGRRTAVEIRAEYPDSMVFDETDHRRNERVLDGLMAPLTRNQDGTPRPEGDALQALAAAGWCAPPTVDYRQVVRGYTGTPVIDSLPAGDMSRGTARVAISPTLSAIRDVTDAGATVDTAALGLWTEAMDEIADDPDDPDFATTLKPIQWVDCPDYATFTAYAVTQMLGFKLMASRANPENTASWTALLATAFARKRESLVLSAMKNDDGTTVLDDEGPALGATADLFEFLYRLAEGMRSADRTGNDTEIIRAYLPSWVVGMVAADMIRSSRSLFSQDIVVARQRIIGELANEGISPVWFRDTPVKPDGTVDGPSQILKRETDGAVPRQWPCQIQFGLNFADHYAFGDGGRIEVGNFRDLSLLRRNRVVQFMETFDGVIARRGPQALWGTKTLAVDGSFAAAKAFTATCEADAS